MKAKLEFDIENLEDVVSHLRCVKAEDMALALLKIKDISKKVYIHKKKYIHTPFPLIENENIYWSSIHHMRDELSIKEINLSLVNIDMNYINQPEKIKEVKLKKISNDFNYKKIFAKKIISEYLNNRSKNKSFSLSRNRFIPPHLYLGAKKFLNTND